MIGRVNFSRYPYRFVIMGRGCGFHKLMGVEIKIPPTIALIHSSVDRRFFTSRIGNATLPSLPGEMNSGAFGFGNRLIIREQKR